MLPEFYVVQNGIHASSKLSSHVITSDHFAFMNWHRDQFFTSEVAACTRLINSVRYPLLPVMQKDGGIAAITSLW
jgi:hypothetical protein